jgi:hypothetical protein
LTVKNGALNFESADAFFKTVKLLNQMSESELDNWEDKIGFTSTRRKLINIFNQIDQCQNDAEVSKILAENKDYVKREEDRILPIMESSLYASITNTDGLFYVGGTAHKVVGNKIYIAKDLQAINNTLLNNGKNNEVTIVDYFIQSKLKSGNCGSRQSGWKETSDRKCDMELKTLRITCNDCCGNFFYNYCVELHIYNYKKNIWGNWKGYQSTCFYKDIAFTVSVPVVTGFNGKSSIYYFTPKTYTINYGESSSQWQHYAKSWEIGDKVQNSEIPHPTFIRVRGKAKNAGMNDVWAEVNCGSW